MTNARYDVVIVGAGPAGLAAALVLARARRRVVVVDAGKPANAPAAESHGFLTRDGVPPGELRAAGLAEVTGYGVEVRDDIALRIRADRAVELAGGGVLTARRVLVATGMSVVPPAIPGVAELWATDVHHCPYCHGWEVRDRSIGLIGGHPRAASLAHLLRGWSADVTFFPHTTPIGDDVRAGLAARGIEVVPGEVRELDTQDGRLQAVRLADGTAVKRDAVFVIPEFTPKDTLLSDAGVRLRDGLVAVDDGGRTSVPWLYAAGDAVRMSQLLAAAGDGNRSGIALDHDLLADDLAQAGIAAPA